jgi:hypothetical protein
VPLGHGVDGECEDEFRIPLQRKPDILLEQPLDIEFPQFRGKPWNCDSKETAES